VARENATRFPASSSFDASSIPKSWISFATGDPAQAVLAPAIRPGAGVIMGFGPPGLLRRSAVRSGAFASPLERFKETMASHGLQHGPAARWGATDPHLGPLPRI